MKQAITRMSYGKVRGCQPEAGGCGAPWRQDGRRRSLARQSHFPHAGDSQFFEGDDLVGVEVFGHKGE